MTLPRTITAKSVLERGPMSLREFADALGIPIKNASSTMRGLLKPGIAEVTTRPGFNRFVYRLAP